MNNTIQIAGSNSGIVANGDVRSNAPDTCTFAPGDVVRLRSGGAAMTISAMEDSVTARVIYFTAGTLNTIKVPLIALKRDTSGIEHK